MITLIYKDKHFYTLREHIRYLLSISMDDALIIDTIAQYWGTAYFDVANILGEEIKLYEKLKEKL